MSALKLAKLPDRTPVKLTITVSPELNKALSQYTDDYNKTYADGEPEPVSELVPFMLQSFLDSDRAFARAQKKRRRDAANGDVETTTDSPRRARTANSSTSSS